MSEYTGQTYTLLINSFQMNFNTFYTLLNNYYQTNLFDSGLRCIIVTFTFMHVQTNKFVYVYLMYEINTDGYIMEVSFTDKIISMNVYFGQEGGLLKTYDMLRIFLNFIIFTSTVFIWYDEKGKLEKKDLNDFGNLFAILLQPTIFANYVICSINVLSFFIKLKFLSYDYTNITKMLSGLNNYEDIQKDLFSTYYWYNILNYVETGLIVALIGRFIMFFWEIDGIRVFTLYIKKAAGKLFYYVFFVVFILGGFSIFANNLWGLSESGFIDIIGSLANVLMNSIGHIKLVENGYDNWNTIYLFLFFVFFIYFLVNTFVGLFLEVYRVTTLMKGHFADRSKDVMGLLDLKKLGKKLLGAAKLVVK